MRMFRIITIISVILITGSLSKKVYSQEDTVSVDSVDTRFIDHSPKKAAIYSAVLPGFGQIYNRKYWKLPIVYAGYGVISYFIADNNSKYKEFKTNLIAVSDDDPLTIYDGPASSAQLKNLMNGYRRNRDLFIIITFAWHALNVIDAHVDAHFINFDVSDDLTMNIQPSAVFAGSRPLLGLSCSFKF